MKDKITIIAPYYNERYSIDYTLKQIKNQTLTPDEVIFVNSNSDDESSRLIDEFINDYQLLNWKNFNTSLTTPSEAKNYGIQKSNNNLLAFMDFDIAFPVNWLEMQFKVFEQNINIEISYGSIDLNPKNYFDKLTVAQTYGINSLNPVVPSSLIKKIYFEKNGLFLPYRSSYDKLFISHSFKFNSKKVFKNDKVKIRYLDISYAKNFIQLFYKTFNYHLQSFFLKNILIPITYIFVFYLFLFLLFLNIKISFFLFVILFVLRGFLIPFQKNKFFFKSFKIIDLPNLFIIGIFMDFIRIVSYHSSLLLKLFNKKIRFDSYYK